MIIYQAEKASFLHDLHHRDIEEVILDSYRAKTGSGVAKGQFQAWANSLAYMGKVLMDEAIPADCGVAIEYTIPQTAKRVDFLITGQTDARKDCVIIVELKQWEWAQKTEKDGIVATRFAQGRVQETSHPSYQAWSYAALLEGYNEAVYKEGIQLSPCAYLHNYSGIEGAILDPFYEAHLRQAPVFLKGEEERRRLQNFIKKHVRYGDKAQTLFRIEGGRIRPSKSLADGLVGLLNGHPEFVLVDDQKLVYETALSQARKARDKGKRVLIVEGGPGTGKSVVAVNLLVGLTKAGMVAKYVTKNAAPRAVYEARLTGVPRKTRYSNLFVGSGAFTEAGLNEFDALVVDEAHRLNEKSGLYGNLGEHQVKEIIRSSRFAVFFVDESQKVTLRDVGDRDTIRKWAKESGAVVEEMALASQFRCNGSDGYLAWLDHMLQIRTTANDHFDSSEFDFRIVDSPVELRDLITKRNRERNRARLVAGYCWNWPSKKDPGAYDIVMPEYGFQARWNLAQDGGLWMVSPDSVSEIGCIHTCQGLETDYIGVIVGDDLVVRDGAVLTRPEKRAPSDKSIRGWKRLASQDPVVARAQTDAIIKNTYRTLMTRGMRGCYVHFTDRETADHFRSRLTGMRSEQPMPIAAGRLELQQTPSAGLPFPLLTPEEARTAPRAVPLIPLKIAAGSFSESQDLPEGIERWVELPEGFTVSPDLFVAQVIGESMNRRIPSGAWCLFRAHPKGTREGKIVLAQHRDISDPETGGSYTIKLYRSEKKHWEGGEWRHEHITLSPLSTDPSHKPIALSPQDGETVAVIAEWIAVIG